MKKPKKLRSRKGETLVEAMVSILVFTLSSILLLTMVTAASNINKAAKEADASRQAQLSAAEEGVNSNIQGAKVGISVGDNAASVTYDVSISQKEPGALYSYFRLSPSRGS